jgi:RNA polymerase sigma-70 factor (ECF subfamily)
MDFENSYEGIDKYAVWFIKRKAKQLVGQVGFTEADREDLEQELIFDLLCHLPNFDPDRASRNTFINRVVEYKVITIIKAQKVGKRDYQLLTYSLNECMEDKNGNQVEHIDNVNQNDYFIKMGKASHSLEELRELSIDIKKIIGNLPPNLHALCQLLPEKTKSEISQSMGVSRITLYKLIKKLRKILEEKEIQDFF